MRKIVIHRDSGRSPQKLKAPLDSRKRGEGRDRVSEWHAHMSRCGNRRRGVCHIVLTDQWPPENLTVTLGRPDRPDSSFRSTFGGYGTLCSILAFHRRLFRKRAPAPPL